MSETVTGVLVTHGAMAQGMVDAVRRISGVEEGALVAVSNDGRGGDELKEAIVEVVGDGPAIVFTDLGAGSCTLAARLTCAQKRRVALLTGVNLPMLLDFVFHRTLPLDELADRLLTRGREGVRLLTTPATHADPPVSR